MIELYSRGIKLDDLQFITDELKEGARAGHWTDPTTVDISCPHDEACSKASGLTPPRWL